MNNDDSFAHFRRFGRLSTRILVHREINLTALDEGSSSNCGTRTSLRRLLGNRGPAAHDEFVTRQPLLGRSLAPTEHVTAPIAYIRLHGRNYDQWFDSDNRNDRYNYLYNEKELAGWKERIENVAERAQTTYVITNNHFESKAGVNALELKAMVTKKRVSAPPTLVQKYPELRRFADPLEDSDGTPPGAQLSLLA